MIKLVFYFSHYNTLGHSTRVFSLVKGLKEYFGKNIKILVLQSGKKQNILPFGRYAKVDIMPYAIDKKGLFIEQKESIYNKFIENSKVKVMLKERLRFMKKKIKTFQPNLFISEYFPFGQEFWTFELPYLLEYLKNEIGCKIVASSGYLNYSNFTYENIKKYYDYLLIHSPKVFCQGYLKYLHKKAVIELDNVFDDFSDKISFTGFIFNDNQRKAVISQKNKLLKNKYEKLILVSRGGGIVNKKIILTALLTAKRNKNLFFLVSTGPATTVNEFRQYKKIAKKIKNAKLKKVINPREFDFYLKACDLSVNMSGYNTIARLLYYRKKTIIVPYYTSEQRWRADLAKNYIPSEIILRKELNPTNLEEAIANLLKGSKKTLKVKQSWFKGMPNTIDKIKWIVQQ
ncbi:MAG: hypothetical protein K9M00_03000 [Candidatus Omnitrophica bacterium]|nr:hypothetical protein [Candidatus Omnitrophota bacterium]